MFMNDSWFARLERVDTSYLLLAMLAGIILSAGILYQIGADRLGIAVPSAWS